MDPLPILLDGDPGHDDAIAWVLAKSRSELDILSVTACGGNQTIEKTTHNAARVMALIDLDVPFAAGRARPLCSEPMTAPNIHGQTGLDGPKLPDPLKAPDPIGAPALMARIIDAEDRAVTLVPTGPLTNIAALLKLYPRVMPKIERISLMGGGIAHGNWTPAAEFNILVDPEAADIVFSSGIPITMAGLDVTEQALVFPEDIRRIRAVDNPVARVVAGWLDFFYTFHRSLGYPGAPLHDAVALLALVRPDLLTAKSIRVDIETGGDYCRGMTIGDVLGTTERPPNVRWICDIDRRAFIDVIVEACESYGGEHR